MVTCGKSVKLTFCLAHAWMYGAAMLISTYGVVLVALLPTLLPLRMFGTSAMQEQSFNSTFIADKRITCETSPDQSVKYPGPTYTCTRIHVDGMRIRYSFINDSVSLSACPRLTLDRLDQGNDISALCEHLLKAHNIYGKLWITFMGHASCENTQYSRVVFIKKGDAFHWEDIGPGNGLLTDLRCTMKPATDVKPGNP